MYSNIIVLFVLIFIYVSVRTFQKIKQNRGHSFPGIDNDFTIKNAVITHKIINKKEFSHTRAYTLTALRDGLSKYKDQFNWTGNKYEMSCTKLGQRYVELPRVDSYSGYEVFFGHVPQKNDDVEVELFWKLHDDHLVSVPFVCKTIYEPTLKLKMVLEVSKGLDIKQVICQECFRNKCSIPIKTEIIDVPESGIVVWEPPNPKLMYNYEMKWHSGLTHLKICYTH
ncbi:MAG: hypothetical protein HY840_08750 [Bacteroidetes bacterium]|nr:hypothetical protein [Bacteroidota bacterium]